MVVGGGTCLNYERYAEQYDRACVLGSKITVTAIDNGTPSTTPASNTIALTVYAQRGSVPFDYSEL